MRVKMHNDPSLTDYEQSLLFREVRCASQKIICGGKIILAHCR